ncbi:MULTISPECIES: ParB N-terminal domain-containing protein [unclassified Snodgrassella]|uniref:ParB N-terminal domain-containing protein n=1 Tax=unclassified Snodgrassella TaxID=2625236 RepID=UPI0018DCE913|nr:MULTISPECIES: ParB N-terminal domain-containing protein [unclassified Snodgrassella]MBI0159577.1 hypothetical protein [Snodgrassella sp. W6238H11]MBI0161762.1 hypothetical protein [Snodgrassella sp. W6238H14]
MTIINQKWYEKHEYKSVDDLQLWDTNPRFNPSRKLETLRDCVEELIKDNNGKEKFINLITSIAKNGFIGLDPIIIWQNNEAGFTVAEGNRRVMALKLLLNPANSPINIRETVTNLSESINKDEIEKINVFLAPSFEDAIWYVTKRHTSTNNGLVSWDRAQQHRFIVNIYNQYHHDPNELEKLTGFDQSTIKGAIYANHIIELKKDEKVTCHLTSDEKNEVLYGTKIKISTLERWFNHSEVKKAWYINFDDYKFKINGDINSFYIAYAHLLKLMINKNESLGFIVNTRTVDDYLQKILEFLPKVKPLQESGTGKPTGGDTVKLTGRDTEKPTGGDTEKPTGGNTEKPTGGNTEKPTGGDTEKPTGGDTEKPTDGDNQVRTGNVQRRNLAYKKHIITTDNHRLYALFEELKKLPTKSYLHLSAAGIRIFLDISVDNYISVRQLQLDLKREKKKNFEDITLTEKLKYLSGLNFESKKATSILQKILNYNNDYSIDTLNKYIHGNTTDKINREFLNSFWDILIPLFEVLVEMKEKKKES